MVLAHAFCGNEQCVVKVRQQIMRENLDGPGSAVVGGKSEPTATSHKIHDSKGCRVCGVTAEILSCGQCEAVPYCSRVHKEALSKHKEGCLEAAPGAT